jgi:Co/Zn/Cd efflux system component
MSRAQRLIVVLVLNLSLVAGLVAVGVGAHSLGVLAEGGDYLLDAAGAGVAAVGAIILVARGWYWLDPAVALVIAVVVGYHAVKLIRKILSRGRSGPVGRADDRR